MLVNKLDRIVNAKIPQVEKIKQLCTTVRDIPYKVTESLDPADVLKNNAGSCTPKHLLLAQYLKKIGVPLKILAVSYCYNKIPLNYPESMKRLVEKMPLTHHTALKIKVDNKWVIIDVTWDSNLKEFEVNKEFDLKSDSILCVVPEEIIERGEDPNNYKKENLNPSQEERELQRKFYTEFNKFIADSRNS